MSYFVELKKLDHASQRRWFMSSDLDLIIFYNKTGEISEFQFCYDKNEHEQMLSWQREGGYSHMAIDDGETRGDLSYKKTPLIVPNGAYQLPVILQKLEQGAQDLPEDIFSFVSEKIKAHPNYT